MSSFRSRRKSSLKGVSDSKEPPGTILKFQWSISAAHLALLEESSSVTLPSIDGDQSQQKLGAVSSSVGGNYNSDIMAMHFDLFFSIRKIRKIILTFLITSASFIIHTVYDKVLPRFNFLNLHPTRPHPIMLNPHSPASVHALDRIG
jgi:hypothetical protein